MSITYFFTNRKLGLNSLLTILLNYCHSVAQVTSFLHDKIKSFSFIHLLKMVMKIQPQHKIVLGRARTFRFVTPHKNQMSNYIQCFASVIQYFLNKNCSIVLRFSISLVCEFFTLLERETKCLKYSDQNLNTVQRK